MLKISNVDFLNLEREFSDEELLIRDSVRRFVDERFLPHIEAYYNQHTFPLEVISEMGKLGLLGCNLEGYGCTKLSAVAYGLMQQELEAGDAGLRSACSVQSSLVMFAIHSYGQYDALSPAHW